MQLLVSIYGGFFGAGMGILMMASLAIGGHEDVQHINALKNLLSAVIYSVTVMTFIVAGAVSWPHTLVMLLTASLGGYWGARMARKIQGPWLRRMVIAVGTRSPFIIFTRRWADPATSHFHLPSFFLFFKGIPMTTNTERTTRHRLQVATELYRFIEDKVLPGTGVDSGKFWKGFDAIVADLAPEEHRPAGRARPPADRAGRLAQGQPRPDRRHAGLPRFSGEDRLPGAAARRT